MAHTLADVTVLLGCARDGLALPTLVGYTLPMGSIPAPWFGNVVQGAGGAGEVADDDEDEARSGRSVWACPGQLYGNPRQDFMDRWVVFTLRATFTACPLIPEAEVRDAVERLRRGEIGALERLVNRLRWVWQRAVGGLRWAQQIRSYRSHAYFSDADELPEGFWANETGSGGGARMPPERFDPAHLVYLYERRDALLDRLAECEREGRIWGDRLSADHWESVADHVYKDDGEEEEEEVEGEKVEGGNEETKRKRKKKRCRRAGKSLRALCIEYGGTIMDRVASVLKALPNEAVGRDWRKVLEYLMRIAKDRGFVSSGDGQRLVAHISFRWRMMQTLWFEMRRRKLTGAVGLTLILNEMVYLDSAYVPGLGIRDAYTCNAPATQERNRRALRSAYTDPLGLLMALVPSPPPYALLSIRLAETALHRLPGFERGGGGAAKEKETEKKKEKMAPKKAGGGGAEGSGSRLGHLTREQEDEGRVAPVIFFNRRSSSGGGRQKQRKESGGTR